jgi:hypothetical protein
MRPLIATQIGKTRVPDIQDYRSLNWGNVMKIALYVAALCSMILFNSPVLAACVQGDLNGSGVSSGSCDPSLHSPGQYASPSGPRARPYRGSRSVSCRLSLRSPGQYTSPSGPGAYLYRGPKSLLCDPSLIKNQVGQTPSVKPELPTFHRPLNAVPAPFRKSVSCRLSLRSPGQYTSPSGPGAYLYRGPKSLLCDPSLIKNQVGQTPSVKPELPVPMTRAFGSARRFR